MSASAIVKCGSLMRTETSSVSCRPSRHWPLPGSGGWTWSKWPLRPTPVCRIIDYGKWQYEQKKKQHEAKKKQTVISVKEIKLRPSIGEHDYEFKKNNALRALEDGDKVKASVRFIGREITHRELGERVLARLEKDLAHVATVEVRPKMEGMTMFVIFTPRK